MTSNEDSNPLLQPKEDKIKEEITEIEFHENANNLRNVTLEGDIATLDVNNGTDDSQPSTLDEPIRETILRDLKAIGRKFFHVLYPKNSSTLLRDWDLWGPLILCTFISVLLQLENDSAHPTGNDGGPQFAGTFLLFWIGALVVTLNTKLLGGDISFFQSVCVLGYCVLPLAVALLICQFLLHAHQTLVLFIIRLVLVILAFLWSTVASVSFLANSQLSNRRPLAVYPIALFYFVLAWLIVSHKTRF